MCRDYKYEMQLEAERLAEEMGMDFHTMSSEQQFQTFNKAMDNWTEQRLAEADLLRDVEKEEQA